MWDHTGPFCAVQRHMEPYGAILDHRGHSGSYRLIQIHTDDTGTNSTIQDKTGPTFEFWSKSGQQHLKSS